MTNVNRISPAIKALLIVVIFGVAGFFGWYTSDEEGKWALPFVIFYGVLTLNSFFSIRFFSSITPPEDLFQRSIDAILVFLYLLLAYVIYEPDYFFPIALLLFIVATSKYVFLIGKIPYPKTLERKITIDSLGILLCVFVLSIAIMGYPNFAAWTLAIVFGLANVYLLLIDPMYESIDRKV
ncbi:MAG TPA: hypothetical protein VD928_00035 [Candidatus Paceibacterota bacterium]|nr:hypothetical protein [Candidatus Paceibacterota bacterium]